MRNAIKAASRQTDAKRTFFLLLSGLALLLPPLSPVSAAKSVYTLREKETPVDARVPVSAGTMIAVEGERIRNAVFDRREVDIQTDAESGRIYVLPKKEGTSLIYITTESGESASVRLTFEEGADAGTVILEKKKKDDWNPSDDFTGLLPLRTSGWSADVKHMVTAVLRNETGETDIVKTGYRSAGPASQKVLARLRPLSAKTLSVWRTTDWEIVSVRIRNTGIRPVALDPEGLCGPGIAAAALTSQSLMPGETASLILLEAPRESVR